MMNYAQGRWKSDEIRICRIKKLPGQTQAPASSNLRPGRFMHGHQTEQKYPAHLTGGETSLPVE